MPVISSPSLSSSWLEALRVAFAGNNHETEDLVVTVSGLEDGIAEDIEIRSALDNQLRAEDLQQVRTVASTIFPTSIWRPERERQHLYETYKRLWPRIQSYRKNRRGTYFQRLIGYPEFSPNEFNQLEQVIGTYLRGNHRRSALQASVIVPSRDLNDARQQGFPCMQQVAFIPKDDSLKLVAYYPMQYMYERAYGNYLGLIHLGRFMAQEMGLTLTSMTCISVIAKAENSASVRTLLEAFPADTHEVENAI